MVTVPHQAISKVTVPHQAIAMVTLPHQAISMVTVPHQAPWLLYPANRPPDHHLFLPSCPQKSINTNASKVDGCYGYSSCPYVCVMFYIYIYILVVFVCAFVCVCAHHTE